MRREDYTQYENKLEYLLIKEIQSTFYSRDISFTDTRNAPDFGYDFAIKNSNGELIRVYIFWSQSAYDLNLNTIQQALIRAQNMTGAEACLAYLDSHEKLWVLSLQDIKNEIKRREEMDYPAKVMVVHTINDYTDIIKRVCENPGWDIKFFFRGHSNREFKPIPGIYRNNAFWKENQLYFEAKRRLPKEFSDDMSTFDNLVKMQHYGLPTRLLDVTTNPLVALYFACLKDANSDKDVDGKVLTYSIPQNRIFYFNSRRVTVLANLAKVSESFDYEKDSNKTYLASIIQRDDIQNFPKGYLRDKTINQVYCVYPKLNNERIIRQEGAFFIYGMDKKKEKQAEIIDKPLEILIKADAKKTILKDLELMGINEASLFPETDKVMKQIKEDVLGIQKPRESHLKEIEERISWEYNTISHVRI